MFLKRFDVLMSKIILRKLFWCFSKRKTLWTVTITTIPNILLIFFQNFELWNIYVLVFSSKNKKSGIIYHKYIS